MCDTTKRTGSHAVVSPLRRSLAAAIGLVALMCIGAVGNGQVVTVIKPNHQCAAGASSGVYFNMCWSDCVAGVVHHPVTGNVCGYWCTNPRPVMHCTPVPNRTCTEVITHDPPGPDCGLRRVNGTLGTDGCCTGGSPDGRCPHSWC